MATPVDHLAEACRILEVPLEASPDEARQSYLDLVKVWHPDRFRDEPERFMAKVEAKLKAINQAYAYVKGNAGPARASFATTTATPPTPPPPAAPVAPTETQSASLTPTRLGELYGYVNRDGRVVIRPQFPAAEHFSEGLAKVGNHRFPSLCRYGYIDWHGEHVIPPQFLDCQPFRDGLAGAVFSTKWGFIDRSGHFVIPPEYDGVKPFSGGLSAVRQRGRWGYVDKRGAYVINPRFDEAEPFESGWGRVRLGERWGQVNVRGELFIESQPAQFA